MATEKQIEILTKLKRNLKKLDVKNISDKYENPEGEYIWAGGPYGLIGNKTCHYEFIFQDDETLNLEVHFEDENCNKFGNVLSKKYKETFAFIDWNCGESYKRIIGKDSNYCIKIDDNNNVDEIVNSAIELLEELDNSIGYSLAKKCDELKPKARLSKKSGKVVNEITYKERFRHYEQNFYSHHGEIQNTLVEKLKHDGNYYGKEIKLDDNSIRIDVLGINGDSYDIYEVKPYVSPTECIREALGQLLYYKYQFEKNGYKVGKLFVVGQNKLGLLDGQYLEKIQKSLPKIDYITP